MSEEKEYTEESLRLNGYVYDGECPSLDKHKANQIWRWRDTNELIRFDPEKQKIVWRETDEIK